MAETVGRHRQQLNGQTASHTPRLPLDASSNCHQVNAEVSGNGEIVKYWHYKQTGIKSRPIKPLRHPVENIERKIVITYLLGIIFKLVAILSGPIIVLLVHLLTIPIVLSRRLTWSLLNLKCAFDAKVKTTDNSSENDWNYCPLNCLESYWFKDKLINTVVLVSKRPKSDSTSRSIDITGIRRVFRQNVLAKPEFRKFLCRVEEKGLPLYKGLYWHYVGLLDGEIHQSARDDEDVISDQHMDRSASLKSADFTTDQSESSVSGVNSAQDVRISIPMRTLDVKLEPVNLCQHIYLDKISMAEGRSLSLSAVRRHAHSLLDMSLDISKPLWEMRVLPSESDAKVFIIFRCHQSLADGRSLVRLLCEHLVESKEQGSTSFIPEGLAFTQPDVGESGQQAESTELHDESDSELKPIKNKRSFVSRISRSSGYRSAIFVGPLTVLLWIIWAYTRRKNNHLNRCSPKRDSGNDSQSDSKESSLDSKRFSTASYSMTIFYQIKQMTRSTANDVILCALSGALRNYLRHYNAISNPPDLSVSLTVDMRQPEFGRSGITEASPTCHNIGLETTVVNAPLPTSVEGAVPRLWELRSTMEELRSSADPWVMLGLQRYLYLLLPNRAYRWLINCAAFCNSSALVSNIRGPVNMVESWCVDLAKRALLESQQPPKIIHADKVKEGVQKKCTSLSLRKSNAKSRVKLQAGLGYISEVYYCMQPPTSNIPISFNFITYHDKIFITSLSRSVLVEDSKLLLQLFLGQLDQLAATVAKRRSLVTYVQCPIPIEINPEPSSPKTTLDFARVIAKRSSGNQSNLPIGFGGPESLEGTSKMRRGSVGIIECLSTNTLMGSHDKCQSCNDRVCLCRRRKSLFAQEPSRQRSGSFLGLFNPGQMMSMRKGKNESGRTTNAGDEHFL